MFALAVGTRQHTRRILYLVLCQMSSSKFIPYSRLHFSECEIWIIWKKSSPSLWQIHLKILDEGLKNVHNPWSSTVSLAAVQHIWFSKHTSASWEVKPLLISPILCPSSHEAGEHRGDKIHSLLQDKPGPLLSEAKPLPHLPTFDHANCAAEEYQLLTTLWEGQIPWDKAGTPPMCTEMDKLPSLLSFFLSLQALFFWGEGWL